VCAIRVSGGVVGEGAVLCKYIHCRRAPQFRSSVALQLCILVGVYSVGISWGRLTNYARNSVSLKC
jgi:hypothetical protein